MRTLNIKVYKYRELDFKTRESIVENFRNDDEFYTGNDIIDTIKAFCNYFNLSLLNYSLGGCDDYIRIDEDTIPTNKKDLRVSRRFLGEYRLTGVCYDYDILVPLTKSFKGKDSKTLIGECFKGIIDTYHNELEYWYSETSIESDIDTNDYDFLSNGDIYNNQF